MQHDRQTAISAGKAAASGTLLPAGQRGSPGSRGSARAGTSAQVTL